MNSYRSGSASRGRSQTSAARKAASGSDNARKQPKQAKQTLFSRASQAVHDAKRARARRRAERLSGRQFEDSRPSEASAGPRAAVYKGEMGRSHRQAQTMMVGGSGGSRSSFRPVSVPAGKNASHTERRRARHPFLVGVAGVFAVVLLAGAFMFPTVQANYKAMREYERTQAEYEAVVERNNELQSSIDALSTDAGVEEYARSSYGWVKSGETSGTVQGLDESELDKTGTVVPTIQPGSVEAETQWYTKYLDALFGVK